MKSKSKSILITSIVIIVFFITLVMLKYFIVELIKINYPSGRIEKRVVSKLDYKFIKPKVGEQVVFTLPDDRHRTLVGFITDFGDKRIDSSDQQPLEKDLVIVKKGEKEYTVPLKDIQGRVLSSSWSMPIGIIILMVLFGIIFMARFLVNRKKEVIPEVLQPVQTLTSSVPFKENPFQKKTTADFVENKIPSAGKKIFFGFLWLVVICIYCVAAGNAINSFIDLYKTPVHFATADFAFMQGYVYSRYVPMILLLALIYSVIASVVGMLPGTGLKKLGRKVPRWAISSFILGLLFFLLPSFITMIFGILAILFGIIGLRKIAKYSDRFTGKEWAVQGIILGFIALILPIVLTVLYHQGHFISRDEATVQHQIRLEKFFRSHSPYQNEGISIDTHQSNHQSEEQIIDEIIELSGMKVWLSDLSSKKEKMFSLSGVITKADVDKVDIVRKIANEIYNSETLNENFYESLRKYYDQNKFENYVNFAKTPLGEKIRNEENILNKVNEEKFKMESEVFFQERHSGDRLTLVLSALRVLKKVRLESASSGYFRAPHLKFQEPSLPVTTIKEEMTVLINEYGYPTQRGTESLFPIQAFLYRNFSDEELADYIYHMLDPDIDYVQEAIYQSFIEAIAKIRKSFLDQVEFSIKEVKGTQGDNVYGALSSEEELGYKRDQAEMLFKKGMEYRETGDLKRMQKSFQKAIILMEELLYLDPDDAKLSVMLAGTYQALDYRTGRAAVLLKVRP
ncbi:MAG: DUF4190 domain-containing protein [Candidatus Omnitrophica bacterium]|nr:DUF4190 domain-containing protein [Candidatus Omnitrophota bacterium]